MRQVLSGRCVQCVLAFVVLVLPLTVLTGRLHADNPVCKNMPHSDDCNADLPTGATAKCSTIVFYNFPGSELADDAIAEICVDANQTDRQKNTFECQYRADGIGGCITARDKNGNLLEAYCWKRFSCDVEKFGNMRRCITTTVLETSTKRTFKNHDDVTPCTKDGGDN